MSNTEDSLPDVGTENEAVTISVDTTVTSIEPSFSSLIDNNIRRAWSAENISDPRLATYNSWWTGEPYFCLNWNWPPFYPPQQQVGYYWNNGLDYSVWNQYCSTDGYGHFSGGFVNTVQDNSFFHGIDPSARPTPYNLFSSQSDANMQRRYYIRRNNSDDNFQRNVTVNPKVLKVLSKRYWEDVRKKKKSSKPGVEFILMSYNVLAQNLINDHFYLYKNHNPRALQWEKRWNNLFEEITKLIPDILCLQEVQESHLTGFYSRLESLGYTGIFKKRTGIRCDGCAIYYKTDKFRLIEYETVEFYQPNVDVLNRDNVAIIAKFSPVASANSEFIVATTHLLYNPKRQDVRLAQTQLLLTEIERLSFNCKSSEGRCYWPIILTGDFNSTPDSAVYELIIKGVLRYDHLAARRLDNSKTVYQGNILVPRELEITDKCQHARLLQKRQKMETISRIEEAALIKLHHSDKSVAKISSEVIENPGLFCSGTLSHLFAFKSVYTHGDMDNVEGTTFQDEWLSVDYIFYSGKKRSENNVKEDKLKLIARYRLPRKSELGSIKIPNSALGSDHLSLVAKFKLKI